MTVLGWQHVRARLRQKLSERKLRRAMTHHGSSNSDPGQGSPGRPGASPLNQLLPRLAAKVSRGENGTSRLEGAETREAEEGEEVKH